ncbi:telomerase protein component 1 [Hypomesus transpacificus]|uniref:telomerase protein component 1 n=1 Tax=Hypomesus transpacificus TaxID=137520 RepID=UPI001F0763B4|nr:telomerase protein component 1 [Hypomesus transpacificus]
MRELTQLQQSLDSNQQTSSTRELFSNYAAPDLENRLLTQASSVLPQTLSASSSSWACSPSSSCPSLLPSKLSSTTSSLLATFTSSASLTSPLLSTQNNLLRRDPLIYPPLSFSRPCSPPLHGSLPSASSAPYTGAHLQRSLYLPSTSCPVQEGQDCRDGGEISCSSEDVQSRCEDMSVCSDLDSKVSRETPVLDMELRLEDPEHPVIISQEDFGEMESGKEDLEDVLKDKKYLLLNEVCCSLVNESPAPGEEDWNTEGVWTRIKNLGEEISNNDPQFLLKVAVYTRQELNIRITANFLLALAASLPVTKPHVRRYFCAAVQLPSDWLEVARLYSTCFSHSLPSCLKKAMADKFKQFNEYQLAKYNTRKHRCKHNRNKPKAKKPTPGQLITWAKKLLMDVPTLQKHLSKRVVVNKKQSEFNLKTFIKRLHIKEPAQHVMAILGKRYPGDMKAFTHSGLTGTWERERAGQRMKLARSDTWERKLSQEGNKALTWEKLIDNRSLPFMAMLRNLRNMISQGISEKHHQKILARLTNKKAVIQSKQFPFRFLSAWKVVRSMDSPSKKVVPSSTKILTSVLKGHLGSKDFRKLQRGGRKKLRAALGVPFIYRMYKMKMSALQKPSQNIGDLLKRYQQALETAVQISCRHNVPPLPGRTLILVSSSLAAYEPWKKALDIGCPIEPDQKSGEEGEEEECTTDVKTLTPNLQEVAVLLSLMIASSAEDPQLVLFSWNSFTDLKLESDVLLDNWRQVMKNVKEFNDDTSEKRSQLISHMSTSENKVNNIIVVTDYNVSNEVNLAINHLRKEANNDVLCVKINLEKREQDSTSDRNYVELCGFSEQILKFVAERGSSRLLDHVELIDKLHNIPSHPAAKTPDTAAALTPLTATPKMRWRGVRVFISSTFRDMHAERDVLVRCVFPELRRRAAQHCLYLQEVELRWGVTEEESSRAVELCLSEVCRSQMLVAILGERYGLVPPRPALPDLPQYSWLDAAPPGLSITEMEIRQFQALFPDSAHNRMFGYFRVPNLSRTVPVAWKSDFASESQEAESKLSDLKRRILNSDVKVTEDYPCEWGGIVDGKPCVKGLERFGKAVLEDLWGAVLKQFVEEPEESDPSSDISSQERHQGALQRLFYGRAKLLKEAVGIVKEAQLKGGLLLLEGAPGEGKSVFMAALANALQTPETSQETSTCGVISYFTDVSQSACAVVSLLRCLVQCLRRRKEDTSTLEERMAAFHSMQRDTKNEKESPLPSTFKDLMAEFHSLLSDTKKNQPLALLVDGADLIHDGQGHRTSSWIPQQLPRGVSLVVSFTSNSPMLLNLAKKKGSVLFPLGTLSLPDRKEIVRKELEVHGKKLSDSAFNNQLQILLRKKGAVSPLYLHLACEELRSFASFEKMKENLQSLPPSLCQLVQHSLARLQSQYSQYGEALHWALAALTVSSTGLRERDLYAILSMCNELPPGEGLSQWQNMLHLARNPRGRIPMATFSHMVRSLESLIGSSYCHGEDDILTLTNPEVRMAFEQLLLHSDASRTQAHSILAAHLWALADPQAEDTFLQCEASSIMQLPHHLMRSGQRATLCSLLSSYYFLFANVRHGLLHHLLEVYTSAEASLSEVDASSLEDCHSFLKTHAALLSSWPALFVQQALNEPHDAPAHTWAQGLLGTGVRSHAVRWHNNTKHPQKQTSELVSTFCLEPTCVEMSPEGEVMAVGTGQGTLHFLHTHTGQEVRSLISSCDGISGCIFLKKGLLGTTSFDGRIEIWDIDNGCRISLIDGHSNRITGSDISANRNHLATVSLDFTLKVWSSSDYHLVSTFTNPSPLNCVTFDPEGQILAVGCWDGAVRVWNWLQEKLVMTLTGHGRSVRSLSFSPSSSSLLCSGSVSGEVRLWSVPASTCVGCYQAHHGTTEVLSFLLGGAVLLSAGSDHMVQLWSGGLGRAVNTFGKRDCVEPGQSMLTSDPAALCVAVSGEDAAVGYHGDGLKLFSLKSDEMTWASEGLQVSILCLLWLTVEGSELLVTGGGDQHLRLWRKEERGEEREMVLLGQFGAHLGPVLALAQSGVYLASASDDFTISLWSLEQLTSGPWADLSVVSVLRGHGGGVTCLAFSPTGQELLSGGKDQTLIVWGCSPPALSKSLPYSHGDWITGCAWTPDCVVSCSRDGRVRVWDLQTGRSVREMVGKASLSALCCLGEFVMAGCSDGALQLWKWGSGMEMSRIKAHHSRIHHCSVLPCPDKTQEVVPENMTVSTASDDGSVKLWKPFQVHHYSSLQGHSGGIRGVVCRQGGVPEFLTVSEDKSLRSWNISTAMEGSPVQGGCITAVCFTRQDVLLMLGYESGRVTIWQHNSMVGLKQVSEGAITSLCSLPEGQVAVGCRMCNVSLWQLEWNPEHSSVSLRKMSTYTMESPVMYLAHCSRLLGMCEDGSIHDVVAGDPENWESKSIMWSNEVCVLGMTPNDGKSVWLLGEKEGKVALGFVYSIGSKMVASSDMDLWMEHPEGKGCFLTALTINDDLVVCGDSKGNMWYSLPPDMNTWSSKKPAHSDRVSVLRMTSTTIISASYDRTVKLWDRITKKQVGMFVCGGPVLVLEVNPHSASELVCGDELGRFYHLSWTG